MLTHKLSWPKAVVAFSLMGGGVIARESPAEAVGARLEIRVTPGDFLIPNNAKPIGLGYSGTAPYFDLVLQTIAFINSGTNRITLEAGQIEVLQGETVLATQTIQTAEIQRTNRSATALQRAGFQSGLDVQYCASSLLPDGIVVSPSLVLGPKTAALIDDSYIVVRGLPDSVRVTAVASDDEGRTVTAETKITVQQVQLQNDYIFPVEPGNWFVMAFPGIKGHHRWTQATEHAIDITMVDPRGSWASGDVHDWHQGSVEKWSDWYAYNKQVLAAADGTVVKVSDEEEFPLEVWGRKKGETVNAYMQRIGALQQQKFLAPNADPVAVAGGNHIVIEHRGGEHTFYAHLAYGSIRVEEGESVKQGQHIAGLGGTGEIPAAHLHFQVGVGSFGALSRTVPVAFQNVTVNNPFVQRYAPALVFQPGFFVEVKVP